jgi:hypothetical protein
MKRQLTYPNVFLQMLALFFLFNASLIGYAQGRSGELPSVKPTPTPVPKSATRVTKPTTPTTAPAPAVPVTPTLIFNQSFKGRLDPKDSEKASNGSLFEEHILNARGDDLLTFQLESSNPSLAVQVFDKDKAEVVVVKDSLTGHFRINTQSGGLPGDGEYKVRVTGPSVGRTTLPYALTVNRLGLLPGIYNDRFQKIIFNFRESDPASVDETLAKLEELAKDDTNKPGTFEFLGIIYLYNRRDINKAAAAMEQAIKANGAAVIKISFDSQWRRMAKIKSGNFDWEDPRQGWLRIRPNQLALSDAGNRPLASLNGSQIKEIAKIISSTNNLVVITAEGVRRPFVFLPGTKEQAEADLVIKLIQTYVMGKTN